MIFFVQLTTRAVWKVFSAYYKHRGIYIRRRIGKIYNVSKKQSVSINTGWEIRYEVKTDINTVFCIEIWEENCVLTPWQYLTFQNTFPWQIAMGQNLQNVYNLKIWREKKKADMVSHSILFSSDHLQSDCNSLPWWKKYIYWTRNET